VLSEVGAPPRLRSASVASTLKPSRSQRNPTPAPARVRRPGSFGFQGPAFPNVPTLDERGLVKDFKFDLWAAVVAPRGVPEPELAKLTAAMGRALQQPQLRKDLEASGVQPAEPMDDGCFEGLSVLRFGGSTLPAHRLFDQLAAGIGFFELLPHPSSGAGDRWRWFDSRSVAFIGTG
jgi:Tripartite tricarboxylate transporter family receptor